MLNSYYVLGNMLKSKDSRMRKKILATLLDLASSVEQTVVQQPMRTCVVTNALTMYSKRLALFTTEGSGGSAKFGGSERTLWRRWL